MYGLKNLKATQKGHFLSIIVISHNLDSAHNLILVKKGSVVQQDTLDELKTYGKTLRVLCQHSNEIYPIYIIIKIVENPFYAQRVDLFLQEIILSRLKCKILMMILITLCRAFSQNIQQSADKQQNIQAVYHRVLIHYLYS